MNTIKLKPEELEKIQAFETEFTQKVQELGAAAYQEVVARNQVVTATEQLNQVGDAKDAYYSKLRDAYGDGVVDLSEGVFIPNTAPSAE